MTHIYKYDILLSKRDKRSLSKGLKSMIKLINKRCGAERVLYNTEEPVINGSIATVKVTNGFSIVDRSINLEEWDLVPFKA